MYDQVVNAPIALTKAWFDTIKKEIGEIRLPQIAQEAYAGIGAAERTVKDAFSDAKDLIQRIKNTKLDELDVGEAGGATKGTGNATIWTRANRMEEYEKCLDNALKVKGHKFEINDHVINSLKKSGRKDIMPDQITRALKQKPTNGDRFSWIYTDLKTGVKVYVNEFNDIVGVQPGSFK